MAVRIVSYVASLHRHGSLLAAGLAL